MKARVRSDRWGFYVRSNNRIYRPHKNHDGIREAKRMNKLIPSLDTEFETQVVDNQTVNVLRPAYLGCQIRYDDTTNPGYEICEPWYDHGSYDRDTEKAWFACEWDMDDSSFKKYTDSMQRQSLDLVKGLLGLFGK